MKLFRDEKRHQATRGVSVDVLLEFFGMKRQPYLFEIDAELGQEKPGSQRPGGIVLVADDQCIHDELFNL